MTTQIDKAVKAYLTARGPVEVNVASRPALTALAGDLNTLWWQEAERILVAAVRSSPDRIILSPEDRLILDTGVLDFRLLNGGDKLRPVLLKELYAPGTPGQFYFSEWIIQRFRQFLLYGGLRTRGDGDLPPTTTQVIRNVRGKLYMRSALLFRDLPGFTKEAIALFLSGRIDESLDVIVGKLERENDEALAERHRQLCEIRSRMIARARDRARTAAELKLIDALRQVDRASFERGDVMDPSGETVSSRAVSFDEREQWMRDELKFVNRVLWLGVMGAGLARTYSVLLSSQMRMVKGAVDPILSLAKECDPMLPDAGTILIAPYTGGGFYEWDRDTLFLPLVPTREPDLAVIQGIASYRILIDRSQEGGRFKKEYESALKGGSEDFGVSFTRDYRAWVLGVGKGFKGALDPVRYAFFRDQLGPREADLYAPREWIGQTPQEKADILQASREKVARREAVFEDYYKLAIHAEIGLQHQQAIDYVEQALRFDPVNGRALCALGLLHTRLAGRNAPASRRRFQECMSVAPGTIWSVYAADELQRT